jgi:DNA-binding transcriptional ArsR family regulator
MAIAETLNTYPDLALEDIQESLRYAAEAEQLKPNAFRYNEASLQQILMTSTATTASEKIVLGFHALSEPLRVKTIELLREKELCVCDLCDLLGVTQSKLSFHLKNLKEAGLIRGDKKGAGFITALTCSICGVRAIFGRVPPLQPYFACTRLQGRSLISSTALLFLIGCFSNDVIHQCYLK